MERLSYPSWTATLSAKYKLETPASESRRNSLAGASYSYSLGFREKWRRPGTEASSHSLDMASSAVSRIWARVVQAAISLLSDLDFSMADWYSPISISCSAALGAVVNSLRNSEWSLRSVFTSRGLAGRASAVRKANWIRESKSSAWVSILTRILWRLPRRSDHLASSTPVPEYS